MSVFDRLRRFLPRNADPAPEPRHPELVTCGIFEHRGTPHLTLPDDNIAGRTVKLVTLPYAFYFRCKQVFAESEELQRRLSEYPTSLRPRRRKPQKKTEIPE